VATRAELEALARAAAAQAHIDPELFVRQINQESGFDPTRYNRTSGATGIAQIIPRWHPGVNPWDVGAALQYAANLMRTHLDRYGNYADALAAYNAGPNGNWANSETTAYVAAILGTGAPPAADPATGAPAAPAPAPSATREGCVPGAVANTTLLLAVLWLLFGP
jgi:soluble lytic murein transglycosylase-like protein